jgi:hypothetical protein
MHSSARAAFVIRVIPALAAAFVASSASGQVLVSEDFNSYTDGSNIAGANAGTGWSGAWGVVGTGATATVQSGALVVDQTTAGGTYSVGRPFTGSNFTTPFTVSFTLTLNNIDSILNGGFAGANDTNAGDYVQVFERNIGSTQSDFGADGSFLIRGGRLNANGNSITNGTATNSFQNAYDASAPLNWYVFNYTPLFANGFTDADVVDTGIALAAGTTYSFSISVIGGGRFTLSISDGVNTFAPSTEFGFRSAATGLEPTFVHRLHYGYSDRGSIANTTTDLVMTVDNVNVVPEPSAILGLIGGAAVLGTLRRRRK